MEGWTTGVCATEDGEMHVRRAGAGRPVVFVHGLAGDGATWGPVALTLADVAEVVAPDARGHGLTTAPARGRGYDEHARDVETLIAELSLDSPVLVGHSMGGVTAALVAAQGRVALSGVVLVDPTFLSPDRQRALEASDVVARHAATLRLPDDEGIADLRARHPSRTPQVVELVWRARRATRPDAFDVLATPAPDYRELARALGVPALLVVGDHEPVVSDDVAGELRRLRPELRVEIVTDAGHGLPFDRPGTLARLVRDFLGSLDGP